jgi:hypothetical protein
LATVAKLPAGSDRKAFREGIREAARVFAQDVRTPTNNELRDEIAALYRAAEREEYDVVAGCLERLSPRGREFLKERAARIGRWDSGGSKRTKSKRTKERPKVTVIGRHGQSITRRSRVATSIAVPTPGDLRDETSRDGACAAVISLCSFGGAFIEGRLRPSGKRSRPVWNPLLHAPEAQRTFDKRDAERKFATLLRIAVIQAGGEEPARTTRHADGSRRLGPFAEFVQQCLLLVGAVDADVVELINGLHQRRLAVERAEATVTHQTLTDHERHRT